MPNPTNTETDSVFNIHTHVFTKDHVPKYLAKKFIVWPFYMVLGIDFVIQIISWFRRKRKFTYTARNKRWTLYQLRMFFVRNPLFNFFYTLFKWATSFIFAYYFLIWIRPLLDTTTLGRWIYPLMDTYLDFMPLVEPGWNQFLLLLLLAILFGHLRNSVTKLAKGRLKRLVGKQRLELLLRYLKIIDFSKNGKMGYIYKNLKQQYPPGSKFVVLPMDMEFMAAGQVAEPYLVQMDELMKLKSNNKESLHPFVFVDPRRIETQDPNTPFFDYDGSNPEKIELNPCKLKEYLEGGACGIKIYPALGYYPFDKNLLSLWLFCAQNDIPITTHCSVGPIFYRGKKKKAWDRHPVFEEVISGSLDKGTAVLERLRLIQVHNKDFQANFTHPLNYCCLLMPHFLKQLLDDYADERLNKLFGYANGSLERNLKTLKINLAHYGGAEHWDTFLERERYHTTNEVVFGPAVALNLQNELKQPGNFYQHWHYSDWFSLISSMLIEFDNVYSDISYTSHDNQYLNLLSEIMNHRKINERVLFGTDFYVVSNHKTEKAFWIDMRNQLAPEKWQKLAQENPNRFVGAS